MYQHIMVPMDGSELAECVIPHVEKIASSGDNVKVTLVRVVPPFHLHDYAEERLPVDERQRLEAKSKETAQNYLDDVAQRLNSKGITADTAVLSGSVTAELVDYANKHQVELIVISTHGRSGIGQLLLGSVADKLVQTSCVPVLMVRAPGCMPPI